MAGYANSPPRNVLDDAMGAEFEHPLAAQELEQHRHPLSARHHLTNNSFEPAKKFSDDFHFVAGAHIIRNDAQFIRADSGANLFNDFVRHRWPAIAKMHDALHARGVMDPGEGFLPIEPRKNI